MVAAIDRADPREIPHTPWPLVQPFPMTAPNPTSKPAMTNSNPLLETI
jgi:hypothetical protein